MPEDYTSDKDAMKAKLKQLESGKTEFWKPDEGSTTIRILPKFGPCRNFWKDLLVHFIGKRSYLCLKSDNPDDSTPCIACDLSEKLMGSDDVDRQEKGAKIQQQVHTLVNIAVNHGNPSATNKVWKVPSSIMRDMLSLYFGDYEGFDHPLTGTDLILNRTGQGMATRYKLTPRRDASKTTKTLMNGRKDLSKVTKSVSAVELRKEIVEFVRQK